MRNYLFLIITVLSFTSLAGVETYSERIEGVQIDPALGGGSSALYDANYFEMATNANWPSDFTNYKVSNFVRLGINPDVIQQTDYSGSVQLEITYHTWNISSSSFTPHTVIKTLSVDYSHSDEFLQIDDASTFVFSGAHLINVRVLTISSLNVSDIFIESQIEVERYYAMSNLIVGFVGDQSLPNSGSTPDYSDPSNEFIELHWSFHTGAESYELEWVHINDYELDANQVIGYKNPNILPFDYYLNSTRIEISTNSYKIPNIFDHGYLVYRVRPIGREGVDFSKRLEGEWSAPEAGVIGVDHPQSNVIFIGREYDPDMNWAHQVGYTEDGKRFEGVSFIDGLGRGRQSVSRNTATDQVVVSNVYYDELGRPVISDLPTPVDQSYPKHFDGFNKADILPSYPDYQSEYFDLTTGGNCNLDSKGMSAQSGASKYYSDNNSPLIDGANIAVPDAEGFPFTRVTYKEDFTGRVDRISGAGGTLKMGAGHESRMIYVSPSQIELNKLFGVEVGSAVHYQKMMTIDANGQAYVQYTDMAGRTVASYMTGESPNNLDPLDEAQGNQIYTHNLIIPSLSHLQDIDLTVPSSTLTYTQFFAESSGMYDFNYEFTPQQFQDACLVAPACLDCVYDLSISIIHECGTEIQIPNPTITINGSTLDAICNGTSQYVLPAFTVEIPQGVYTITKRLTVNQQDMEDYWCTYLENISETCLPPTDDIFNDFYASESFPECTPEETPSLVGVNDCDIKREVMLLDVSPGGQYGVFTVSQGGIYSSTDPTSVYTPSVAANQNNPNLVNGQWWTGTYLDGQGLPVTFTSGDLELFITSFREEWAEELLPSHPEACFLDLCTSNSASYAYDQSMLDTYSFNDACAAGFISPLGSLLSGFPAPISNCATAPIDPFFDMNGEGVSFAGAMANGVFSGTNLITPGINNFIQVDGVNFGLLEYIMAIIIDPDASTATEIQNAIAIFESNLNPTNPNWECDIDLLWVRFRSAYLELKSYYYQQAQEAYASTYCTDYGIGIAGSGNYENKTPIFPSTAYVVGQLNITSTQYGGVGNININSQGSVQGLFTSIQQDACEDACTIYADEWVAELSGCTGIESDPDIADIKQAFINLCTNGCDENHLGGASTPNPNSVVVDPITGLTNPTVQQILTHFGYSESELCTELLIDAPLPYDNATAVVDNLMVPLDACGCDAVYEAENDLSNYPSGTTLEEVLSINTGVELDDAHHIICACDKAFRSDDTYQVWGPGYVWEQPLADNTLAGLGIDIPESLSCPESQGCSNCDDVNAEVSTLLNRFGATDFDVFMALQNAETILQNYLNTQLNFNLSYSDYIHFISGCNVDTNDPDYTPYCVLNPIVEQLTEVLELVAYRGQLTSSGTIDLVQENIVYQYSNLSDEGVGQFYSSTSSGNQLTASFSDGAGGICHFAMTLPTGATFDFEDILAFGQVFPTTADCYDNFDFDVEVTYLDCGISTTGIVHVSNTCFEVNLCVCGDEGQILCNEPYFTFDDVCYQPTLDHLYQLTVEEYEENVANQYLYFRENYNATCSEAFYTEDFSYEGPDRYYQFTLFYYDQSGNLVQTVAPEGIDLLANANSPAIDSHRDAVTSSSSGPAPVLGTTLPDHDFKTIYEYNSYGQLSSTTNPDQEGDTKFWYDRYGRIIASQNPVQAPYAYSYSLYDLQGRPVEVGQIDRRKKNGTTLLPFTEAQIKQDNLGAWFKNWVYGGERSEVTITTYDKYPTNALSKFKQVPNSRYLRLRVSAVRYYKKITASINYDTDFETATYFSYDIHGNVVENIQDVPLLAAVEQDIKSTQYEFELISGNVEQVIYQEEELDEFVHEYEYDALNRLEEVFTVSDGVHRSGEAHYYYYDYGPLARTEIGQYQVQGQDFAYTINGWLKAMNGSTLSKTDDIGGDGKTGYLTNNTNIHSLFARDINAYTVGYFDGDYTPIGTNTMEMTSIATDPFSTQSKDLYNGNIRHLVTSVYGVKTLGTAYSYDQLQRLKEMTAFYNINTDNTWSGMSSTKDYHNAYTYDRNGNITNLQRNGTAATNSLLMDNFAYTYTTLQSALSNRLDYVSDTGADDGTSLEGDIKAGMSAGNYDYDNIGQLIEDVDEEIASIEWRKGDKKMLKLTREPSSLMPDMEFVYNPFGIRVLKIEKTKSSPGFYAPEEEWKYTYYSYDANGQTMAVYDVTMSSASNKAYIDEHHIYGASRLGMLKEGELIYDNGAVAPSTSDIIQHTLGDKRYELTNHLGNVQAVITDRRTWNSTDANYEATVVMTSDYYPFGMKMPDPCDNNGNLQVETASYANILTEDFSNPAEVNNWQTVGNNGTTTTTTVQNGELTITATALNDHAAKEITGLTIGQEYRVIVDVTHNTQNGVLLLFASSTISMQPLSNGTNTVNFIAPATSVFVEFKECGTPLQSTSSVITADDLIIEHVNTAVQTVTCIGYIQQDNYRYAYNGMEVDNEVSGNGNSYTTEFRQYDPRLGRWKSLDPLMAKYPEHSPYVAFNNNPIYYTDPFGDDPPEDDGNPGIPATNPETGEDWKYGEKYEVLDDDGNVTQWIFRRKDADGVNHWKRGEQMPVMGGDYADAAHVIGEKKRKWVGDKDFVWNHSKKGYYWGDQNIDDLNDIKKEFISSGAYDRYTEPVTIEAFGESLTLGGGDYTGSISERIDRLALIWWKRKVYDYYEPAREHIRAGMKVRIALGGEGPGLIKPQAFVGGGLKLYKGVKKVLGRSYKAAGEVVVQIKNQSLLQKLTAQDPGKWVKVYEAGVQNGAKMEMHYFRNETTGKIFDLKKKYDKWHQKAFKEL